MGTSLGNDAIDSDGVCYTSVIISLTISLLNRSVHDTLLP